MNGKTRCQYALTVAPHMSGRESGASFAAIMATIDEERDSRVSDGGKGVAELVMGKGIA